MSQEHLVTCWSHPVQDNIPQVSPSSSQVLSKSMSAVCSLECHAKHFRRIKCTAASCSAVQGSGGAVQCSAVEWRLWVQVSPLSRRLAVGRWPAVAVEPCGGTLLALTQHRGTEQGSERRKEALQVTQGLK